MKTLYESLLDDEEDLLDNDIIFTGILDPKNKSLYDKTFDILFKHISSLQKKIKIDGDKIANGEVFEKDKIYIMFDLNSKAKNVNIFKLSKKKEYKYLCLFGPGVTCWYGCYRPLLAYKKMHFAPNCKLYELPQKYYKLWNILHNDINPSNNDFNIN